MKESEGKGRETWKHASIEEQAGESSGATEILWVWVEGKGEGNTATWEHRRAGNEF